MKTRGALLAGCLAAAGCMSHVPSPARLPHDARGGFAPRGFDARRACADWRDAVGRDGDALRHVSFPELAPALACFTRVRYRGETPTPDAPPRGCAFDPRGAAAAIGAEAERDERIARGEPAARPVELACALPDRVRRAAAANNARTLRAVLADARSYPYAIVAAFGYGSYAHAGTALDAWLPGEACPRGIDLQRFGINVDRAARAALAWAGRVAPLVVVSGGAVHSRLVEAFLLDYVATCRLGVPADRVLLDPCAAHTHENVRNVASVLRALSGRAGYVVTDDSFQAVYLQEWTAFDLFGGSIDQRSLRDFGHLVGSWRQASTGGEAAFGFWLTPYRFWADSRYRDFSCDK
jgi:hypothetical protein